MTPFVLESICSLKGLLRCTSDMLDGKHVLTNDDAQAIRFFSKQRFSVCGSSLTIQLTPLHSGLNPIPKCHRKSRLRRSPTFTEGSHVYPTTSGCLVAYSVERGCFVSLANRSSSFLRVKGLDQMIIEADFFGALSVRVCSLPCHGD